MASAALESYIPTPEITSDSKFFVMDGNNVTLTCHVNLHDAHVMYALFFVFNGKRIESDDVYILSEMQHDQHDVMKTHRNLTIIDATAVRDHGDYKCVVMDHYNNTNSVTKTLDFVTEPTVELNPDNQVVKVQGQLSKKRKQAKFNIKYKAIPEATFYIFNPDQEQISTDEMVMKREKYTVRIKPDEIEFAVKYPDIHDFGDYKILASSAGKNFSTSVRLVVSEMPTVAIDDAYVRVGESVNMTCKVIAYPEATVTWGFMACSDLSLWPECGRPNVSEIFNQ